MYALHTVFVGRVPEDPTLYCLYLFEKSALLTQVSQTQVIHLKYMKQVE